MPGALKHSGQVGGLQSSSLGWWSLRDKSWRCVHLSLSGRDPCSGIRHLFSLPPPPTPRSPLPGHTLLRPSPRPASLPEGHGAPPTRTHHLPGAPYFFLQTGGHCTVTANTPSPLLKGGVGSPNFALEPVTQVLADCFP